MEEEAQLLSTVAVNCTKQPFCSVHAVAHQSVSSLSAAAARALTSVLATGELMETEGVFLYLATPGSVACGRLYLCMLLHSAGPWSPLGRPAVTVTRTIRIKQHHSRAGALWRWDITHPLVISMSLSIASLSF